MLIIQLFTPYTCCNCQLLSLTFFLKKIFFTCRLMMMRTWLWLISRRWYLYLIAMHKCASHLTRIFKSSLLVIFIIYPCILKICGFIPFCTFTLKTTNSNKICFTMSQYAGTSTVMLNAFTSFSGKGSEDLLAALENFPSLHILIYISSMDLLIA